ncbi:hypothetical protein QJS83_03225 [Bdellovibrio sp. 22V]|uniref:hypothetical protein n=1 Tax=Bdellovibrio TaxID=958 RepID=UPI002543D0DB|nr:hypothetical protein [Bdellovibrio sp. 22V]WII72881.1 hypothetical protein QJS83_03225 [Bdellovibrio sp. 22V]
MKKTILFGMLMLGTSVSSASTVQKFIGDYQLQKSQVDGETFCYQGIMIREDDGLLSLYRSDISYSALISAEVNGEAREVSASHGEAMTSTKGKDTVTLDKSGTLTFDFTGRSNILGIPAMRESDSLALKLSADGKTAYAVRKTFEGPVAGLGKKGKALCEYRKIN